VGKERRSEVTGDLAEYLMTGLVELEKTLRRNSRGKTTRDECDQIMGMRGSLLAECEDEAYIGALQYLEDDFQEWLGNFGEAQ
jgi:hypothetical protein